MDRWTALEVVVGLLFFGVILQIVKPYVPSQIMPLFNIAEVACNTAAIITKNIINGLITALQIIVNLIQSG